MIRELDVVALTHDIREEKLKEGDTGTVVYRDESGADFIVEFFAPSGLTIAVVALTKEDIRLVESVAPSTD